MNRGCVYKRCLRLWGKMNHECVCKHCLRFTGPSGGLPIRGYGQPGCWLRVILKTERKTERMLILLGFVVFGGDFFLSEEL